MILEQTRIMDLKPQVLPRACGGWLAISPKWGRFSIGVTGGTEDEAREAFRLAFARWVTIVDDMVQENT